MILYRMHCDLVKDILWWRTNEDVVKNKFRELLNDNDVTVLATYVIDNR